MKQVVVSTFDVSHKHLAWPWIAVDPTRQRFAFVTELGHVETRGLSDGGLKEGPRFVLPAGLELPSTPAPTTGHRGAERGLHGLALAPEGLRIAAAGVVDGSSVVVTLGASGESKASRVDALTGSDLTAHALTFDRSGVRLWLSAESPTETALVLLDADTHAVLGVVRSAAFPRPSLHELHTHPQDDAVLLLAACGQEGTFARVAGWSDGPPEGVPTALDAGSVPSGFVGFSRDGARVHLVEADELRTHAWPGLQELSSVPLPDDFISAYAGVVLGDRILVDGHDEETGDFDAVMIFDRSAIRGVMARDPVPSGMWVGRLGVDMILTVAAKGEPAQGFLVRLPAEAN